MRQSAGYLAQRIRTIDSPAIIMQRTPAQIPYSNPAQLVISPVIDLIPRILWPGKPILTVGYQISQEYYQLPRAGVHIVESHARKATCTGMAAGSR